MNSYNLNRLQTKLTWARLNPSYYAISENIIVPFDEVLDLFTDVSEMAHKLGVSRQTVYNWKMSKNTVSLTLLLTRGIFD